MHHSFPFYNSIIQEEHLPKYLKSKHKRVIFGRDESIESLWRIHEKSLQDTNCDNESCSPSLLDIKAELAFRIHQHCHFCEHRCSINRDKNMGKCTSKESLIASEFLHYGEESMLVPSHTIFFSGCSLYCVFC